MSAEKNDGKESKYNIPYAPIKNIIGVIDSIRAKGGHSSKDVLKTTMGINDSDFFCGLSSDTELGLIQPKGDEYELTPLGQSFAAANEDERKKIMVKIIVGYEPYNTILWRIKNAPSSTLSKEDMIKAWFAFNKSGSDRVRQEYTRSFASICDWMGIMENGKMEVELNDLGKSLLENTLNAEHTIDNQDGTVNSLKESAVNPPTNANATISPTTSKPTLAIPINTSITVNIIVDTKEQNSVDNFLKIIKALKGES